VPREMTKEDIKKVIIDFRDAARRALDAGFKVIEIHAAHGYLLNSFLSPLSNQRRDEYGGEFGNAIRLLVEVVEEVRSVWPVQYPLFVRISATDWLETGWHENDSVALARVLKDKGVDLIDCSSGGNVSGVKVPAGPCYQVPFAEIVKKQAGIMTGAVGLITTQKEAESIISSGRADLVFIARELLRDPYFPLHAARVLDEDIAWPVQYERAKPK
jgi:2,4-dienoyl-CoA reductase-like NADH-dependent reductase (Old Yellow Enzyme family)